MTAYAFIVPGEPVAKGRARSTRSGRHYTPARTVSFEGRVREAAQLARVKPIDGPVELTVIAVWAWPKSKHRKRSPRRPEYLDTGPDADNVAKACADALNGVAFVDDRQVARLVVEKRRPEQGDPPAVHIEIRELARDVEVEESRRLGMPL